MKKLKLYKALLIEIIETLIGICMYLESFQRYGARGVTLRSHARELSKFSEILRNKPKEKFSGHSAEFYFDEDLKNR